jgi:hypothetical protein
MKTWACNWHPELRFGWLEAYENHMDDRHEGWGNDTVLVDCPTCETAHLCGEDTAVLMGPRCMHCPPVTCDDCGEPDDRTCSCWVSIEDMSLADKKALFAADGTFNIGTNGEVTVG